MESGDCEIINSNKTNDNVATSAKASQAISSKWLVFCLFVLLGHVQYLVMNLVSEMLLKQEAATITNEQLILIIEAMFVIVVSGKYINEAENLVTKLKSEMEREYQNTKMFMEGWCKLGTKYEKLTEKNSKLENEHGSSIKP